MIKKMNKDTIELTVRFFQLRFPEKDIAFEMKCGYFWEWATRLQTEDPKIFMDKKSTKIWEVLSKCQ